MRNTRLVMVVAAGLALLPVPAAMADAGSVQLVSINGAGTATGNAQSYDGLASSYNERGGVNTSQPVTSRDGRYVVFTSFATDLIQVPTSGQGDVFRRDTATGTTTLVSVARAGGRGGNAGSHRAFVSTNGRHVIFQSSATDLVAGAGGTYGIFHRDVSTGITRAVSVAPNGAFANEPAYMEAISGNGRFVVFSSTATNLQPGCSVGTPSQYVRDLVAGTTTVVNVDNTGTNCGNSFSHGPLQISDDGRYVSFESFSSDLVDNDGNTSTDVFVRDLAARRTILVSVGTSGESSLAGGALPSMSANGRFVVFQACADDLVTNDRNSACDIFIRDVQVGSTMLVSINRTGTASGNNLFDRVSQTFVGGSFQSAISLNGQYVAFTSGSTDLVAGDTNRQADLFVRNLSSGTTKLVQGGGPGWLPLLSASGRYLLFTSVASLDLYVSDQQTGQVTLVNRAAPGSEGLSSPPRSARISRDGSTVVFSSRATNLVNTPDVNPSLFPGAPSGEDVFAVRLR